MLELQLGETEKEILKYVSRHNFYDGITRYQIYRESECLSRSTVYCVTDDMKRKGLLIEKEAGRAPAGQKKRYYGPALKGLITVMNKSEELWDYIDEIAYKQARLLPLIFGKWAYFSLSMNLREVLTEELKEKFEDIPPHVEFYSEDCSDNLESTRTDEMEMELSCRAEIYKRILKSETFVKYGEDLREEYITAIMGDEELTVLVRKISEIRKKISKRKLSVHESVLNSIEEKNPELFVEDGYEFSEENSDAGLLETVYRLESNVLRDSF